VLIPIVMVSPPKTEFEHVQLRAAYASSGPAVKTFFERVQILVLERVFLVLNARQRQLFVKGLPV